LRGPCLLALCPQVTPVEWGRVPGKGLEDFKAEGCLAARVRVCLQLAIAMEMLAKQEELAVLCGVQVGAGGVTA
jgi:hypothetical protein